MAATLFETLREMREIQEQSDRAFHDWLTASGIAEGPPNWPADMDDREILALVNRTRPHTAPHPRRDAPTRRLLKAKWKQLDALYLQAMDQAIEQKLGAANDRAE